MRAARREPAARGRRKQRRRRARDRGETARPGPVDARHRAQQPPRVRMLRIAEDIRSRALLDHAACVHHDHPLGEVGDDAHVVGDQDDRGAVVALKALHQLQDLSLDRHVERGRRLVGDQERGIARESHGDHHALPHPARELMRVVVGAAARIRDPDLAQKLDRPHLGGPRAHPLVLAQLLGDLPADPVDRRQRGHRILEDHRDLLAPDGPHLTLRELHQIAAAVKNLTFDDRVRIADQAHHAQHRDGLPGSRLAHDAEDLALPEREREAVDRAHDAFLGAKRDAQVADFQEGLRHGAPAGRETHTSGRRPRSRRRRRTRHRSRFP